MNYYKKTMDFPVYRIIVNENDETGLSAVSLVDYPAVELDFIMFDKEQMLFKTDEEKHIISGIALLADVPIYRMSKTRGEYYVIFQPETIRHLVEKYSKNGLFNSVNLQHTENSFVDKVYMIESLIVDKKRGLCPAEFEDVTDGSWYVSYYIEDPVLWEAIKTGEWFRGFSVELIAGVELVEDQNNKETDNMSKLFKLAKMLLKLAEIKTDKETLLVEGELEIGKPVVVETEEGVIEAADGEYLAEDGTKITVEGGLITEIETGQTEEEVKEPETEELAEEETPEEDTKTAELEAKIAELEALVAEQEEKLKMSVETPITKKYSFENKENKALKYF